MTTKKRREFWVTEFQNQFDEWQPLHATRNKTKAFNNAGNSGRVIHVREVLPEPTVDSINQLGKESYDQFLIRYHEKPDFAEAYLMGFRAALAWMRGRDE